MRHKPKKIKILMEPGNYRSLMLFLRFKLRHEDVNAPLEFENIINELGKSSDQLEDNYTKTSTAKQVIAEMHKMEKLMLKHSSFGASDTEPEEVYQFAVADYLQCKWETLPKTASDWQLFSTMKGVEAIAKQLTNQLTRVQDMLLVLPAGQLSEVKKYVSKEYWRVNW